MPVFRSGVGLAPAWCEMEFFEIVNVPAGEAHRFSRIGAKEKLIVCKGEARIRFAGQTIEADEGADLDLARGGDGFEVVEALSDCELVRMCGHWGDETGGSGVFAVAPSETAEEKGDPGGYEKNTTIDNHFHDCDEYWIILEGHGVAMSEGQAYEISPGDCVATGMGHHHDLAYLREPLRGVYFETTLEGEKRLGHLWNHTHGQSEPRHERV